jgi:hypothetical protein
MANLEQTLGGVRNRRLNCKGLPAGMGSYFDCAYGSSGVSLSRCGLVCTGGPYPSGTANHMEVDRMEFGPTCPTNSVQIAHTLSRCVFISPYNHISLPGALLRRKSFGRDLRQDFDLYSLFSGNHVHITQSRLLRLTRIFRTILR